MCRLSLGRPGAVRSTWMACMTAVNWVQSLVLPPVTVKPNGRPSPSHTRWILPVRQPRDRLSPGLPPLGPGSDHLNLRLGGPQHPFKDAVGRPPAEPGVRGGSGSVPLGLISPGRARTELPYDPGQDHLVVQPLFPAGTADGSARANSRSECDSSWRRITRPPIRRDRLTTSPRRTPVRRPAPRSPPGSCRQRRRRPGSSRHRPRRGPRRNRCRCRPRKPRPW